MPEAFSENSKNVQDVILDWISEALISIIQAFLSSFKMCQSYHGFERCLAGVKWSLSVLCPEPTGFVPGIALRAKDVPRKAVLAGRMRNSGTSCDSCDQDQRMDPDPF